MIEHTRETIAYAIIIALLTAALPVAVVTFQRRRRVKLRRRGIKTYRR